MISVCINALDPFISRHGSKKCSELPPREKTPEELRIELLDNKKQNPSSYLNLTYNLEVKVRLIRESEDRINGTIINSATMATIKDVVLSVKFITNTDAVLETRSYTVYEFIIPNGSKDLK